ncbi:hypothetical protein [Streptomyces sp. NBC_01481]|uniref:hypothetical protein n=1 Tax=Streptomyces sp. NBC_01481 TaxID=2975869 RepID=UPI00225A2E03|nr:hypothetical protein [Streptomyces sp. NBC_01481]MCX4581893.1 hypothetical protein [Streptomyces sp. NBC_01481]
MTPAAQTALDQAAQRLLAGCSQRSDGSLTVAALAREAQVSRATAYRAGDVLQAFRQRVDERSGDPDIPVTLREQIRELQGEVREARRARHEEITALRRSVDALAQRVQGLTLDNQRLRAELARQGTLAVLPTAGPPPG